MLSLALLAPLFLLFEAWQLFVGERYLGIKQIARTADPRTLGLGESTAFGWTATLFAYWLWILLLLADRLTRVHGLCLLAAFALGYLIRRNTPFKAILVVLTVEGAVRIGLLASLVITIWRRLS